MLISQGKFLHEPSRSVLLRKAFFKVVCILLTILVVVRFVLYQMTSQVACKECDCSVMSILASLVGVLFKPGRYANALSCDMDGKQRSTWTREWQSVSLIMLKTK